MHTWDDITICVSLLGTSYQMHEPSICDSYYDVFVVKCYFFYCMCTREQNVNISQKRIDAAVVNYLHDYYFIGKRSLYIQGEDYNPIIYLQN
jgi:hypothetical protein